MNFQEAEGEYERLKAQLDAGALTEDQFEARLQALMVQDGQGRWWTIGGATGQWYVHDGVNWVIGEPSAPTTPPPPRPSGAAPQAPATPPTVPPVQSSEKSSAGRKPWLWAVLGVLIVAILAVLLSRLVPEPAANNAPKQTQVAPVANPTEITAARALSPVPPTATRPNLEATATSQAAATDAAGRTQKETATAQVAGTAVAATQTRSAQSKTAASATAAAPATATPTRPISVTQTATVKPTVYPLVACATGPGPSFAGAWTAGNLRATLGCATKPEASPSTSFEPFANGFMVWRGDTRRAYVFYKDGAWQEFADTWAEGQPEYGCIDAYTPAQTPPTPHRGFGKVWCEQPGVRDRLGAALQDEIGNDRAVQDFENGAMLLIPERSGKPIVLSRDGSKWQEAP
jgi:hypothetical protein